MKLLFSLILFGSAVEAREIVLITYNENKVVAESVIQKLKQDMNLPEKLVTIEVVTDDLCNKKGNPIIQICITNSGEMKFPVYKQEIVRNSFRIFSNTQKELFYED